MPITGSDKALMQARFGPMRFGASRIGYYHPNVIVKVDGSDVAASVRKDSLVVQDELDDRPNTCSFVLIAPAAVALNDTVTIASGSDQVGCREFVGRVTRITQLQSHATAPVFHLVDAIDDSWDLTRELVLKRWEGESASTIAAELFTDAGFSAAEVESGLDTIDVFECQYELRDRALTRLAEIVGARWYVDTEDVGHFFVTAETVQNPPDLTSSNTNFWDLQYAQHIEQLRTRRLVSAAGGETLVTIPAGTALNSLGYGIPLDDDAGWRFNPASGGSDHPARIGPYRIGYARAIQVLGPPHSFLNGAVSAGATSVTVDDATIFSAGFGWFSDGAGHYFGGHPNGATTLDTIPASGYGALAVDLADNTLIRQHHNLEIVTLLSHGAVVPYDILPGTPVHPIVEVDDAAGQAAHGVRERHSMEPEKWTHEAAAMAAGELARYATPIASLRYRTRNPFAKAGRTVTVSLGSPTSISETFVIQRVQTAWVDQGVTTAGHVHAFPVRTVEAAPVRFVGSVDFLTRER
jgi:hypothetical protein